jgi:hypothetical protein
VAEAAAKRRDDLVSVDGNDDGSLPLLTEEGCRCSAYKARGVDERRRRWLSSLARSLWPAAEPASQQTRAVTPEIVAAEYGISIPPSPSSSLARGALKIDEGKERPVLVVDYLSHSMK